VAGETKFTEKALTVNEKEITIKNQVFEKKEDHKGYGNNSYIAVKIVIIL